MTESRENPYAARPPQGPPKGAEPELPQTTVVDLANQTQDCGREWAVPKKLSDDDVRVIESIVMLRCNPTSAQQALQTDEQRADYLGIPVARYTMLQFTEVARRRFVEVSRGLAAGYLPAAVMATASSSLRPGPGQVPATRLLADLAGATDAPKQAPAGGVTIKFEMLLRDAKPKPVVIDTEDQ